MPKFQNVEIKDFKGFVDKGPFELNKVNELSACINFIVGNNGELKKRQGIKRTVTGLISGGVGANARDPVKVNGAFYGQSLFFANGRDFVGNINPHVGRTYSTTDGITWTNRRVNVPPDTDTGQTFQGIEYLGGWYVPSATFGLLNFNTPTGKFDLIANSPNTQMDAALAQDRLFVWDKTADNLKFTDPGNFSSWPAANFIGTSGDKTPTQAIVAYREKIVIFKLDRIWVLSLTGAPASWSLRQLPWSKGCNDYNAVQVIDDLIYFVSRDGVYRTDLTSMQEISSPIRGVFNHRDNAVQPNVTTVTPPEWNLDLRYFADSLSYWNKKIIVTLRTEQGSSVGSAMGEIYRILVYNLDNSTWTEWIPSMAGVTQSFDPFYSGYNMPKPFSVVGSLQAGLYLGGLDTLGNLYYYQEANELYGDGPTNVINVTTFAISSYINNDAPVNWKRVPMVSMRATGIINPNAALSFIPENDNALTQTRFLPTITNRPQIKMKGFGFYRNVKLFFQDTSVNNVKIEDIVLHVKSKTEMLTDQKS